MSEFQNTNLDDFAKPERPNNYLVIAIVGTVLGLCNCIPAILGIIAIVFATQVNSKYDAGDYAGAESSSNTAKILGFISLGLAILGLVVGVIYWIIAGASILEQYQNAM
ncbi:CD225/dispanin family protein [Dysgonomonas sp. BGC7]|uniref:CD225/dispanin family protein n=1 Tax=Dysgonomonas sp. BGC7 TaxID=1658008 RepID=UPI0006818F37|nr:CD225/dispanin family protein [Dysgonomonas sp. BGC7]MBD8389223.1 CD225/dispanin family protein [Dysgonomonas sp. BGC7]